MLPELSVDQNEFPHKFKPVTRCSGSEKHTHLGRNLKTNLETLARSEHFSLYLLAISKEVISDDEMYFRCNLPYLDFVNDSTFCKSINKCKKLIFYVRI